MEHNTDRILWTVLALAIGVALYVGFKEPANGLLGQVTEKIQTIAGNVHGDINNSSSTNSNSSSSSGNAAVGTNLLTGTSKNEVSGKSYYFATYQIAGGLQPGTTYTLSGLARVDQKAMDNRQHVFVSAHTTDWSWGVDLNINGSLTSKYNKVTFTTPSGNHQFASNVIVYLSHPNGADYSDYSQDSISGTGYISKLKLEKGDKATPYTP